MEDVTVEYNHRGEWQWVRRPSRLHNRNSYVAYELGTSHRRHSATHSRSQRRRQRTPNDFPPFPEIEKLIRFYVMTGEGRGSFRAAEQSEALEDMMTRGTSERRSYLAHSHRRGPHRDSSSSDSPPDDYDASRPSAPAGPVPGSGYGHGAGPRVRIPRRPMRPPPGYVNSPSRLDSYGDHRRPSREAEDVTTDDAFIRRTRSRRQEAHVNIEQDDDYYRSPKFRPSRVTISRPERPFPSSSAPVETAAGASSTSAQRPPIVINENRPDTYDNDQAFNAAANVEVEEEVVVAVPAPLPAHRHHHPVPVVVNERPQAPVRHYQPNIPRPPPPQPPPPPPPPVVSGDRPRPYQFGHIVDARPNIQARPRPVRHDRPVRVVEVRPPPRAQQRPDVDHAHPWRVPSGWAGVPRPPPPSGRARRQHQAYVESEGSEDDQDLIATIPPQERDYREMAAMRQRRNSRRQSRIVEVVAEGGQGHLRDRGGLAMRGGHIDSLELNEPPPGYSSDDDESSCLGRLRGGAIAPPFPPTKTAAIAAGVLPSPSVMGDTTQKDIFLIFFTISRGKIVTSQMWVTYTTFQEVPRRRRRNLQGYLNIKDPTQLSDQWLIDKLFEHYERINRQQQTIWWDMISMRTIGFASFIRFEQYDPNIDTGYAVTAKVPAIIARPEEAMSKFEYHLKYPLKWGKMMLYNLDRLAATTEKNANPKTADPDRRAFYAVEIKEAMNTRKMYLLLVGLIVISTAGGATFAVLREDISTGLSIATYILTCLSLMLALVAAGQWFGLSKPDSFSFAYDMDINRILGVNEEK